MRQNKTNLKYKAGPIRFSRHIKCAVDRVIPGDDWGQGGLDMRTYWLKSKMATHSLSWICGNIFIHRSS